jgi:hypothetical protein
VTRGEWLAFQDASDDLADHRRDSFSEGMLRLEHGIAGSRYGRREKLGMLAAVKFVVLLPALWGTLGCSYLFVNAPPDGAEDQDTQVAVDCTSSSAMPSLDVVLVAASLANVALIAASDEWDDSEKALFIPVHAGYGVLHSASAVYGFRATARCREVERRFEAQQGRWTPSIKSEGQASPDVPAEPPAEER